ncbi:unnamed protein product [Dibothriocephalus latus]|uniref:Uncharacterized protein n=1 Tax=Dibothriocephalus latus TaxID=60516 RepID=A0A3P7L0Y9_DIBLA|nr:unnamed protein product [Dibothriocephalus latus]
MFSLGASVAPADVIALRDRIREVLFFFSDIGTDFVSKKIAYRQRMIIQAQKYARGWLCRRKCKKVLDVLRQLRTLAAQLDSVKAQYENLNGYKGTGMANIAQLQRQLKNFDKIKYSDIEDSLAKLTANVADVQAELRKHQELERQNEVERQASAKAKLEEEEEKKKLMAEAAQNGLS